MKIGSERFLLKDGREAVMRSPEAADAEECELFVKMDTDGRSAMVLCLVEGRIAGVCHISASDRVKTAHRASIRYSGAEGILGAGNRHEAA